MVGAETIAPAPVGFAEADADVVVWFVDAAESQGVRGMESVRRYK
jgi:hypothetical protein